MDVLKVMMVAVVVSGGLCLVGHSIPLPETAIPRLSPRPIKIDGVRNAQIDLNGRWRFNPAPCDGFMTNSFEVTSSVGWADIQVPGQWLQQGFAVAPDSAAGYVRQFDLPADWRGKRIKLRCDAVYSDVTIWVGGREVGRHQGGFTPFECDVTEAVQHGRENTIALRVQSGSDADKLASGIQYACHDLGGITRKIYLVALPELNVAALRIRSTFDSQFKNAELTVDFSLANESLMMSSPASLGLELRSPEEHKVGVAAVTVPAIKAGKIAALQIRMKVAKPLKWDVEHPNLYTVKIVFGSGRTAETLSSRFGFRQVEVRGNQMFVNGNVVKLRGVCRHEVHPTRGRSLEGDLWRRDAELFARGNVNLIRTSHYPPAEEFLEACDEVGLLVELEAPICWAGHGASFKRLKAPDSQAVDDYVLQANLESVGMSYNHPSVILRSLANESNWNPLFAGVNAAVRQADPTRPVAFHDQCWGGANNLGSTEMQVGNYHYPGLDGPAKGDESKRPLYFGEYCHLNAYNRREQMGDPGLRDAWGLGFANMWETMRAHPGCLGGSLWAAMDDTFFLPGERTVGYGTWGPLDGWRRPKPEYWHMTKAYSPVRILDETVCVPPLGDPIRLTVENRSDFANLDEMRFDWKLAWKSGRTKVEAAPGQKGILVVPAKFRDLAGEVLEISVTGPRGFTVDRYRYIIGGEALVAPAPMRKLGSLELTQATNEIAISGKGFKYLIDSASGQLKAGKAGRHEFSLSGPCLTMIPLDSEGGGAQLTGKEPEFKPLWGLYTGWKASSVTVMQTGQVVGVKVAGAYAEAEGGYELLIDGSGRLSVNWAFTSKQEINPRQTGMTFGLPETCDTLTWRRRGQWTVYPEDHIGRLSGTAKAFRGHPDCGLAGPRTQPAWSWSEDQNQYGCNDFRSTKSNIFEAALKDGHGVGLRAVAAADRHAHAWIDGGKAMLMVADYVNEGAEGYLQCTRAIPDRKVPKGGTISGSAQVEVTGN
jgi:beta-galactosidase